MMTTILKPESLSKRSPVYRQLKNLAFNNSKEQLARGSLIDLSLQSRCGVRGPNAISWLQDQGLAIPEVPNQLTETEAGHCILRLGQNEHWLLSNPLKPDDSVADISHAGAGCYPTYCEDSRSWFVLTGENKAAILAKLCGVDLRETNFPINVIAQTSLARVNGVIVHHSIGDNNVFSIFSDSASAEYLWEALLDAMAEFEGAVASVNSLQ